MMTAEVLVIDPRVSKEEKFAEKLREEALEYISNYE